MRALVIAFVATLLTIELSHALAATKKATPSGTVRPKVSRADARATALAVVPEGILESAELEHEKGALVWSFDIRETRSRNVTEILIDAQTGRIVSRKLETSAEQASEAKADRGAMR